MHKKVVIAGGTGFIGSYLTQNFSSNGYQVNIISRKNNIGWNETDKIVQAIENSSLLINLAGKSVDCRYNEKNKNEIIQSRTETTKILGKALLKCQHPPELWLNSSTATIYRHAEDRAMTEKNGDIGSGFSVNVAKSWEKTFFDFKLPRTRQIALRMAIVLGKDGGAMKPLTNLVRVGLGGMQGNGRQMISWIHIEDLYNIILFLKSNKEFTGVYNCASPNPVDNKTFMKTIRHAVGFPFGLPSPKILLEFGAVFLRTETELILKSRWVIPEKLLQAGYKFKYATLDNAIQNILHNEK